MSRRPIKKARAAVTYERPWTEAMASLFDLVGHDWRAPAYVKVRRTVRALTVKATFISPAGLRFTAYARIRIQGGGWVQTQEALGATFSIQGTAP